MHVPYPDSRTEDVTDTLAGVTFPDRYRWLESDTPEVRAWQHAQGEIASRHVRSWPHFDALRALVASFNVASRIVLPRHAAGLWFRIHSAAGDNQGKVIVSREPVGEGRVLFDPWAEDAHAPPYVSWIAPSPDGKILALGLCTDGSEANRIRLIDVVSGSLLPEPPEIMLMDNWTGGAHWLADSSGFFFTGMTGPAIDFEQDVYLHRRVPVPGTQRVAIPWITAKDWRMVVVARDGRTAVAVERLTRPIPIAIAMMDGSPLRWRPFVTSIEGTLAGHVIGDRYVAITDIEAPRGRLVAIPLDTDNANDARNWHELVPESQHTLRTLTPIGETLYLTQLADTYAAVRAVDLHGRELESVRLAGPGAIAELPFPIMNLVPQTQRKTFLFGFSSFEHSWAIYSHVPGAASSVLLQPAEARLEGIVVEDRWAISADETRIPYHIVRRGDLAPDHPQPTMIYGYGGFNVPLLPQFPGPMAALIAAGGVFVHAHLRGGGEFGLDWWQGGRQKNKRNGFRDLYAIAEDLIQTQRTTPRLLAVTGGSNGGLMAGVATAERPELWRAVVPRVPMLDLVGACREAYGRMCISMEYADVEHPDEVRRLAGFSPYQLIREDQSYPAVYIDAGAADPRCPPWHARKFIARLQALAGCPVALLHVWEKVGHGWATSKNIAIEEHSEWLAFVLQQLSIDWPGL
jgi:prolyl oligopeptidase